MSKAEMLFEIEGSVVEKLPNAMFHSRVRDGHQVLLITRQAAYELQPILPGDKVTLEMSPMI